MGYQLIETITVGSGGAASIEFTGIPQDANSLVLTLSGRTDFNGNTRPIYVTINNDNTTTYQNLFLRGNGSAADTSPVPTTLGIGLGGGNAATSTTNTFSSHELTFANYAGSSQKSTSLNVVTENNAAAAEQAIWAGLWPQTSAITALKLTPLGANFVYYTTASLYKITA